MPTCRSDRVAGAITLAISLALPAMAMADGGWPRTIPHEGGALVLEAQPQRIVSTSPGLTGTLLALDVPLVATATAMKTPLADEEGFFLQWADEARAKGVEVLYPHLAFDFEALIVQDADLVIAAATGGDSIMPYLAELQAMEIPVMVLDYGTNDWTELARRIGRATGHEAEATRVTEAYKAHAAKVAAEMTRPDGTVSIVSYNFAGTYGVSKPISAQAQVLADLGFVVTGLPDEMRGRVQESREYDFISHENLAAGITGDSVFLLNGTPDIVRTFLADPVLANVPAVRAGRVYPLGPLSFRVDYYSALDIIDTVAPYFTE